MKELIQISKYSGMREDLVQAGGGNSSIKLDCCRMAIKASGIQLADITEGSGYSIVDYPMIRSYMDALVQGTSPCSDEEILERALLEGKRPSIETFLHAVTGKVTLHTHPVSVNILASRTGGMERIKKRFPEALLVGYATPGVELAKLYYKTYLEAFWQGRRSFPVIFLKNHGLIVSGDTAEEVIRLTETVNEAVEGMAGIDNAAYRHAYELYEKFREAGLDDGKIVVKAENRYILDAYIAFKKRVWNYQICPDCVVFCGKRAFEFPETGWKEALEGHTMRHGVPILISYGGDLFIRAGSVRKAREIESVLAFSARIAMANRDIPMDLLSEREQDFLLGWDAEKYRQSMK